MNDLFQNCLDSFEETSGNLRSCAACLIEGNRIGEAQRTLVYLSRLLELKEEYGLFVDTLMMQAPAQQEPVRPDKQKKSVSLESAKPIVQEDAPYYFMRDGSLVKIGKAPSVSTGYYKKIVPNKSLRVLLEALVSYLGDKHNDTFTINRFIKFAADWALGCGLEKPKDYHVHLVVGALYRAGLLERGDERSTYRPARENIDVTMLEEGLMRLEKKEELFTRAK